MRGVSGYILRLKISWMIVGWRPIVKQNLFKFNSSERSSSSRNKPIVY